MTTLLFSSGTFFFLKGKLSQSYSGTAYALQGGGCTAGCAFCAQSRFSSSRDMLSRVKWYPMDLDEAKGRMGAFKRFCLQTVYRPGFREEALEVMKKVNTKGKSLTTVPVEGLEEFAEAGVDYIGVGLDTTEDMFTRISKPFPFSRYMEFIEEAVEVFGKRRVYVHLVFGLGEKSEDFLSLMERIYSMGAEVALFAFTPVKGTLMQDMSPPSIQDYRVVQTVRYYLSRGYPLSRIIKDGKLLLPSERYHFNTSGCPTCDRPFYNESPKDKELYNIPKVMRD
ncbi:radical SAM protein [Sulfuracidifex tepidarius]|uniref:Biotin synthase n=1 Tax=Sulfuracidifex tepidarius TaxID=1294262 RepID=A0A510DS38_9CREN|nr:radical SAM protein [Sulfuracidifex tepidarius]BBG22988.1 Biotin synthase [Sulfuracidifex tepidarius]BBG25749.1 Biotin synthase [Sulfuracidifex tepidarius]